MFLPPGIWDHKITEVWKNEAGSFDRSVLPRCHFFSVVDLWFSHLKRLKPMQQSVKMRNKLLRNRSVELAKKHYMIEIHQKQLLEKRTRFNPLVRQMAVGQNYK